MGKNEAMQEADMKPVELVDSAKGFEFSLVSRNGLDKEKKLEKKSQCKTRKTL